MRSINSFPPPSDKKTEDSAAAKFILSIFMIAGTSAIYTACIGALMWTLEIAAPALWRIFLAVVIVQFLRAFDFAVIQSKLVGLRKN